MAAQEALAGEDLAAVGAGGVVRRGGHVVLQRLGRGVLVATLGALEVPRDGRGESLGSYFKCLIKQAHDH